MKAFLLFAVLAALIAVGVMTLITYGSSTDRRAPGEGRVNDALKPGTKKALANAAVDSAIALGILSSFDNTEKARARTSRKALNELKAITKNTNSMLDTRARMAAERMTKLSFGSKLGWASARDYIDDQKRVGSLFDQALGVELDETMQHANKGYASQHSSFAQALNRDQEGFGARMRARSVVAPLSHFSAKPVPVFRPSEFRPRILSAVGRGLRTRFPGIIRKASMRVGMKELARAPGAALDGPVPLVDTALLIWGLYDIGDGAVGLVSSAKREIASSISIEAKSIVSHRHKQVSDALIESEKLAKSERCHILSTGLGPLLYPAKKLEFTKRCAS